MKTEYLRILSEYMAHLEHERHVALNTTLAYRLFLLDFVRYLRKNQLELDGVDHRDIRGYMRILRDKGNSKNSVATKIACIRTFLRWCEARQYIEYNPANVLTAPRLNSPLPSFLTQPEAEEFLLAPILALRDMAILDVFYSTGIRLSELTGISLGDINWTERLIRVTGKGSKERLVLYGKKTEQSLARYLQVRGRLAEKNPEEKALFLNTLGERLSSRQIQLLFTKYNIVTDVEKSKPITPHSLRHSCASVLLDKGCGLREIQTLLRHESLSTTQKYTHVSPTQLIETYKKSGLGDKK